MPLSHEDLNLYLHMESWGFILAISPAYFNWNICWCSLLIFNSFLGWTITRGFTLLFRVCLILWNFWILIESRSYRTSKKKLFIKVWSAETCINTFRFLNMQGHIDCPLYIYAVLKHVSNSCMHGGAILLRKLFLLGISY